MAMEKSFTKGFRALRLSESRSAADERDVEAPYLIDERTEKKLLNKLDFRIIPALWFLFLVSFFDRSNIG